MKLNLFYGRTYFESFEKIIYDLMKNYSKQENYLFIVPDRFTLFTEKYIMEKLNLQSTFNIDVVTLNTLANRNCLINDYVDNETASMLLSKVVYNIRDNLKVLKSTQGSFSEEVYALISQIKSSRVTGEEFLNCEFTGSDYEKFKKQDLALIYYEYEKYLSETGVDDVKKFEMFIEEIKNIDTIKNSYIYVAGFESFTSQGYGILENLIRYSKGVKVASINYLTQRNKQNNSFLYPCDVSFELSQIAKRLKIECVVDDRKFSIGNGYLVENLWLPKSQKSDGSIEVFEAKSSINEYRKVAEIIMNNIAKGNNKIKFSDFNIIMNNAELESNITRVLDDYNISYFCDSSKSLANFIVIKFISQINECVVKNLDKLSFIEFSKSPFVEGTIEQKNLLENFANRYSIRNNGFFKESQTLSNVEGYQEFFDYSKNIAEQILNYKKMFTISRDKVSNYILGVKEMIKSFELKEKFEIMLEKYKDENKELQYRYGQKVFERLENLIDNLNRVLGDTVMPFKEFVSIFQSGLCATKISIAPQSADAVFVGDVNASFFLPRKYNLFLDCVNGTMPSLIEDKGIFSDEDIDNSKTKYKINPQIKMLNKKKKLKILSLMSLGRLLFFYTSENGNEPSKIIDDLGKLYSVNYHQVESKDETMSYAYGKNSLLEHLAGTYRFNPNFVNSTQKLLDCDFNNKLNKLILSKQQENYLEHSDNYFFENDEFSISEIENFYTCPFMHFLNYGLRLKQNESGDLTAIQVGNIIHEFCEKSINAINKGKTEIEVAEKIFDDLIDDEKYISIKVNVKNKSLILGLKSECKRIFDVLKYQIKYSDLPKHFAEYKFSADFGVLFFDNIKEKSFSFKFKGKVDRIDWDDEDFIIIDYKTGHTDMNFTDIYYGKKLQILSYALAIEKLTGKKCIGFFYMPLKNAFRQTNENAFENFKLSGIYLKSLLKAVKIDKRIASIFDDKLEFDSEFDVRINRKSDILNLVIDKENDIKESSNNLDLWQIDKLKEYTLKMIDSALKEINNGNIMVLPSKIGLNSSCDYCEYAGICKRDKFKNPERRLDSVTKKDFYSRFETEEENNVSE